MRFFVLEGERKLEFDSVEERDTWLVSKGEKPQGMWGIETPGSFAAELRLREAEEYDNS